MKRWSVILLIMMCVVGGVYAQAPDADCPGFRNTTNFNTSNPNFYWSARVGERVSPNSANDTTTGYYVMSTCAASNATPIVGHANITSATYNSGNDNGGGITCCNHGNLFDANDKRFQIITAANAGMDEFTVNGPGTGMPRIPEGYTTSIRLGDPRASGSCSSSHSWSSGSNKGSEALFYTMQVTSGNALLFINYAVVGRCYPHTAREAGEFLIRVVKQNDDGSWPNEPINDNLWFKVSAPDIPTSGPIPPWVNGRPGTSCGSTTCAYVYKPWTKVAISLADYIYSNVRIEMYTSDCIYNVDPLYAYIAGDFQPMALHSSGCPAPESDVVDTLSAPEGMLSYQWFVCNSGAAVNIYDTAFMNSLSFHQVWPPLAGAVDTVRNYYCPTVQDFVLTEGSNAGDTVPEKTFLCVMTSALDPAKPFASKVYANVTNRRPLIRYRYEAHCDRSVTFYNGSYVLVPEGLDEEATYWVFYEDAACTVPIDTVRGNNVTYTFPAAGEYGAMIYCVTAGSPCAISENFRFTVIEQPPAAFVAEKHVLCDGEEAVFRCTEGCDLMKTWIVDDTMVFRSSMGDDRNELRVALGLGEHSVVLETMTADSCTTRVYDTVRVYGVPTLELSSTHSSICYGDSVTIDASGNIAYEWNAAPPDPSMVGQEHGSSITVAPMQSTTYYLRALEQNPCFTDQVSIQVDVIPYPELQMRISPEYVSFENNRVTFDDVSHYRSYTQWAFSDGQTAEGARVIHDFGNLNADSVWVKMTSCNELDCCSDTTVSLPVQTFSVWFPNAFMPEAETDNRFGIITSLPLREYEIQIYNRLGLLVYTNTDPNEPWDGRDMEGRPMPSGAYAYVYRYLGPQDNGYRTGKGTVLLLR